MAEKPKKRVNSKAKGKRGEREWAIFCRSRGHSDARRTAQYCGNTGDASDVVGLPGVHQEVKRVERLNVDEAMAQAIHDAKMAGNGDLPIVAHRKNGRPWLVTMVAEDWLKLYDEWSENCERKISNPGTAIDAAGADSD